jgi:hypothetical protein
MWPSVLQEKLTATKNKHHVHCKYKLRGLLFQDVISNFALENYEKEICNT